MVDKSVNRNAEIAFPLFAVAALILIAGLTVLLGGVRDGAGANERAIKTVTLGGGGSLPDPACPVACRVVASSNGFQVKSPTSGSPFYVPFSGEITSFRLYLGKPSRSDRNKLNERFGAPPQAALAVLKKIRTTAGQTKFKLRKKSPIENLGPELGTVATFRLATPLKVQKGNIVALAIPTWAPVFAQGLNPDQNRWRASLQPNRCSDAFIDQAKPQLKVGSKRQYGCKYPGGRLLYTVTVKSG